MTTERRSAPLPSPPIVDLEAHAAVAAADRVPGVRAADQPAEVGGDADGTPDVSDAGGRLRLAEQARAAIAFLETVRDQPAVLAQLGQEARAQLMKAAGQVARPEPEAKRAMARAGRKLRRKDRRAQDDEVLDKTGIREQRRQPVFVTPLRFAPVAAGEGLDRALEEKHAQAAAGRTLPSPDRHDEAWRENEPTQRTVAVPRTCYVCKIKFQTLHFFYDSLCTRCGDLNYRKRQQSADLRGRVAVVTGGRVKIGYQAAIMLLRAGARVVVSTRFPRDAAARFAREQDFEAWSDRIEVHGLDLRHTPSVEIFARHLCEAHERLDFIVNNACQTVRRPAGFYGHLLQAEALPLHELSAGAQRALQPYEAMRASLPARALARGRERDAAARSSLLAEASSHASGLAETAGLQQPALLSQLALLDEDLDRSTQLFPEGALDADLQQVDLRGRNTWRLGLSEVSAVELLEVQLVNAVAPFILNARLKALMMRTKRADKHIVNVSAMEGQFYRSFKTDKHPHTNMAKAALNMLTRTSAAEYVRDGIHMNSVDTGWVTDEDPAEIATRKTLEHGFHPPLDIVDGAARICDPIFDGHNTGKHVWGLFLKDYAPTDW